MASTTLAPSYKQINAFTVFACGICMAKKSAKQHLVKVAGDDVCQECFDVEIKPKFLAALRHEHDAVIWGTTTLSAKNFPSLSPALKVMSRTKEKEYRTPIVKRVYCKHQVVVGKPKHAISPAEIADSQGTEECGRFFGRRSQTKYMKLTCLRCRGKTCGTCGQPFSSSRHDCFVKPSVQEPDPFEGLIRGQHYQICPNSACKVKVELTDGCNAMYCTKCRQHFCFLCGAKAHHDDHTHWTAGGCPRWNQAGAASAHHDQDAAQNDGFADYIAGVTQAIADEQQAAELTVDEDIRRWHMDRSLLLGVTIQMETEAQAAFADGRDPPEGLIALNEAHLVLYSAIEIYAIPMGRVLPEAQSQVIVARREMLEARRALIDDETLQRYPVFVEVNERYAEVVAMHLH